jgi:hypothetical protein
MTGMVSRRLLTFYGILVAERKTAREVPKKTAETI